MKVLDRIDGRGEDKSATGEQIGVVSIADFDAASMARDEGISARHTGISAESKEHAMPTRNEIAMLDAARGSEEHTSELQSLMRTSYPGFGLTKQKPRRSTSSRQHE